MIVLPSSVAFNGKFIAQPVTGVQRFANELIREVDRQLARGDWQAQIPMELVVPAGHRDRAPVLSHIRVREVAGRNLHLWEQICLPRATPGAMVVNLSGSAPLLKRGQVCTFHDAALFDIPQAYSGAFGRWYRFLFRVQSRISSRVLTVSDFSRARLSHHLGLPENRFGVVHNAATHFAAIPSNDSVLKQFQLDPGAYFLAVGSDNPSKNFGALLEAFRDLPLPQARLVVVGGGNRAVFATLGKGHPEIDRRIVRTGRLDDPSLKSLYRHALAFVFPSLYEGFGIPPLEAMSCDCPVLAASAASIPEVCGDAAGYFEPGSPMSIRDALARAYNEPHWLEALRIKGPARVKLFSWEASAERLLTELAELGVVRRKVA
jgi:glycosyltransferase involved in cell wall biosynthesis